MGESGGEIETVAMIMALKNFSQFSCCHVFNFVQNISPVNMNWLSIYEKDIMFSKTSSIKYNQLYGTWEEFSHKQNTLKTPAIAVSGEKLVN